MKRGDDPHPCPSFGGLHGVGTPEIFDLSAPRWLEAQRDLKDKDLKLDALLGNGTFKRPVWMLFTEADTWHLQRLINLLINY